MAKFEVALSSDFRSADGAPAFPDFDLSPLQNNAQIGFRYIEPIDGEIPGDALDDVDALILLVHKFTKSSVPKSKRLAIVARFGVGYDTVDVEACTNNDIALVIAPDGVRRPVAVSILTFLLALAGNLMAKDQLVRQGPKGWSRRADFMGTGLIGRTLGQLGMGNIGAEVFRLAKPFGLKFIAHDPFADPSMAATLGVELVDLETLFKRSDFLSVSCPLSEATTHIVNAERLALMKPTSFLINTSRGPVVDQNALYDALLNKRIAGAGLDVFETEPTPLGEPVTTLDNVILAPHALCFTDQCFAGLGAADIAACLAVMKGELPRSIVNEKVTQQPGFQIQIGELRQKTLEPKKTQETKSKRSIKGRHDLT